MFIQRSEIDVLLVPTMIIRVIFITGVLEVIVGLLFNARIGVIDKQPWAEDLPNVVILAACEQEEGRLGAVIPCLATDSVSLAHGSERELVQEKQTEFFLSIVWSKHDHLWDGEQAEHEEDNHQLEFQIEEVLDRNAVLKERILLLELADFFLFH